MAIRKYKPTTPGRRQSSVSMFEEITRSKPEKSLVRPLPKKGGRNVHGHITVRHKGGGHKRRYRIIDFRRNDKDLSLMHLPRGELGLLTLTDARHGALHGNRILSRIQHARNAAHRIGVALAHALAPEGIVLALRQNRGCQHTV